MSKWHLLPAQKKLSDRVTRSAPSWLPPVTRRAAECRKVLCLWLEAAGIAGQSPAKNEGAAQSAYI